MVGLTFRGIMVCFTKLNFFLVFVYQVNLLCTELIQRGYQDTKDALLALKKDKPEVWNAISSETFKLFDISSFTFFLRGFYLF
jgi:hypothetical protein